jgi:cell division protein FtsA
VENVGGLSDSVDSPRFATVVGLAQYGAHRLHINGATANARGATRGAGDGQVDRFARRVKDWLQDFF